MVLFLVVTCFLLVVDLKNLWGKVPKWEIAVYMVLMLLAGLFGAFYYSNPDAESFSKIMLSLIGQEG